MPTIGIGSPAAVVTLPTIDGERVTIPDQNASTVLLVNFWATWCVPCREEMPALQRLADELRGQPFQVVEVDLQEDTTTVREFEQQLGLQLFTLLDQDGTAARAYGVRALPATFLLDRNGVLRAKRLGPLLAEGSASTPWTVAWLRKQIRDLITA